MRNLAKPCAVGPNGRANSQARNKLRIAMNRENQHLTKGGKKPAGSQAPVDDVMSVGGSELTIPGQVEPETNTFSPQPGVAKPPDRDSDSDCDISSLVDHVLDS